MNGCPTEVDAAAGAFLPRIVTPLLRVVFRHTWLLTKCFTNSPNPLLDRNFKNRMKSFVFVVTFLLALANARVAKPWVNDKNVTDVAVVAGERSLPLPYPFATDEFYNKCKCKGENLRRAMHSSSADASKLFNPVRDSSESTYSDTCKMQQQFFHE